MHAYLIYMELMEPTFFASREIGNFYETEGLIGNYALCYALGLASSPYSCNGGPRYEADLTNLNKKRIYITPASPAEETQFSLTSFNALSDSYWYEMAQNAVNVDKGKRARAINYPQIGRLKQLALGNRFIFAIFSKEALMAEQKKIYIRLGKWMSKAKLQWRKVVLDLMEGRFIIPLYINSVDLLEKERAERFDLTSIYPTPILRNVLYHGPVYRFRNSMTGMDITYPQGVRFGGKMWQE